MIIKTKLIINNRNGASLLEVMIAMVILTVGFLGVMALAIALTNNNATAGKINTATAIAQAQVSQLNCLGVSGIEQYFPQVNPWTYTYTVNPTVLTPDLRNTVTSCINSALAAGGPAPDSPAPTGLGVTLPYTVSINFSNNPNPTSATVINAQVEVSWQDTTQHVIVMNDLIS
ncbi:MAG: prepilin-type N-terminal cleavage/methylation domain-containing protein [Deltaproteobacteria bacterium]|jgi:Tfp pilus assembly protein PilV|nr:prepilin-type N-terminal cleavage/methylation domain-containing protein [Deltaproteobacteria bacterium]